MQAVSTSPFNLSMLRKHNVWYTIKDGNWSDPAIWIGNGTKRHSLPQVGDDVVINHKVVYDNNLITTYAFNNNINNLTINGTLLCSAVTSAGTFLVSGNINCPGTLDLSGSTSGGGIVVLIAGVFNSITNFVTGNSISKITIGYTSPCSFVIPNIHYYNLFISGGNNSVKSTSGDLNTDGVLVVDAATTFELGGYNATVKDLSIAGTLSKDSSSGYFTVTNSSNSNLFGTVNFTGSPTVNWSGNMNSTDLRNGVNFGTGTFNLLTNSIWTFSSGGNTPTSIGACNFIIASGVTLTLNGSAAWLNNGTVNGVDGTSLLNVSTSYCYGNSNVVMATGVFNHNFSGTSTMFSEGTVSIPALSYYNLNIASGTATLAGNTTVSNNLTVGSTFQLASYNLTVSGTTTFQGTILKSGSGTVNFNILTNSNSSGKIDFSAGNPIVNLSGNVTGDCRNGLDFGSTPVNITASINLGIWTAGNTAYSSTNSFLIAPGKTLTNTGLSNATGGIATTGTINGADGTAIFDNRSVCSYENVSAPMLTGKLYCDEATNTFIYGLTGGQDIMVPSDATPGYQNLTLNGSGTKRLLGNVSIKGAYTLTPPAMLNLNGFALTNP